MMFVLADAWVHSLDPVAFSIGSLSIRWYGLSYVSGFLVAGLLLHWLSLRGATPIPKSRAMDVVVWLVAGVLIGGRVGYALLYQPSLIWTFRPDAPFWDLLALHRGGMASHGGMVGVCVAAMRICRGWREPGGEIAGRCPPLHVMDMIALIATPGLLFGRVANFINGELLGRIVAGPGEDAPWWSVRYWQEVPERWDDLDQTQKVLLAQSAGIRPEWVAAEDPDALVAVIDHVNMLGLAVQKGAPDAAEQLSALLNARHPSQLYQALAEGLITGVVLWIIARAPRRPGVIGSWFLFVYGIGRIATEYVRLPDVHIERFLTLSRGQWLSVAMIVVGLGILWLVTRGPWSKQPLIGGWASGVHGKG